MTDHLQCGSVVLSSQVQACMGQYGLLPQTLIRDGWRVYMLSHYTVTYTTDCTSHICTTCIILSVHCIYNENFQFTLTCVNYMPA
jgi:hypothetical protein